MFCINILCILAMVYYIYYKHARSRLHKKLATYCFIWSSDIANCPISTTVFFIIIILLSALVCFLFCSCIGI